MKKRNKIEKIRDVPKSTSVQCFTDLAK